MERKTKEVKIKLNWTDKNEIETGDKIFDHMLDTMFFYMDRPARISATWDLKHHLWEDTGILIGKVLKEEADEKKVARFGEATMPMDDALVLAALDISRPYLNFPDLPEGEGFHPTLVEEFLNGLSRNLKATIQLVKLNGENPHHLIEACFKGLGASLKEALEEEGETKSTKGRL